MDERTSRTKPARGNSTSDGMVALSYFMSGIALYGGLGWAGAHYLDQAWMLPTGLVLGFVASTYLVIKRYSYTADVVSAGSKNMTSEKEQ